MAEKLVWARRPMTYCGQSLDRGQVVTLHNAVNDERLVRLGYFEELKPRASRLSECGVCGASFIDDSMRTGHGEKRHARERGEGLSVVAMGVGEGFLDTTGDAEEHRLNQIAPLYLDKTEASQKP